MSSPRSASDLALISHPQTLARPHASSKVWYADRGSWIVLARAGGIERKLAVPTDAT